MFATANAFWRNFWLVWDKKDRLSQAASNNNKFFQLLSSSKWPSPPASCLASWNLKGPISNYPIQSFAQLTQSTCFLVWSENHLINQPPSCQPEHSLAGWGMPLTKRGQMFKFFIPTYRRTHKKKNNINHPLHSFLSLSQNNNLFISFHIKRISGAEEGDFVCRANIDEFHIHILWRKINTNDSNYWKNKNKLELWNTLNYYSARMDMRIIWMENK